MLIAVVVAALALSAAQARVEGWFGTWELNLEKSIYNPGPPPYKRASYRIEPLDSAQGKPQDGIKVVYDMVRPRGGVTHMEWTGRLDGMDYAVQGVEEYVTNAYRAVSDREWEVVLKVDGRVAARSRISLSADGNTMTTVTTGRNAQGADVKTTTVYERSRAPE
jgi:hypothetical protein